MPQMVQRLLQAETLEPRVLLAGDVHSSWQNPLNFNDVDQNGMVTWQDALSVIRSINHEGARQLPARAAGEPGSASEVRLPDTNGDGFLTPADALRVINELNGEGEGELVGYRLEITDRDGNPVSSATVGDELLLRGYVQDLRDPTEAQGVFSGYLDVLYDPALISVPATDAITFGDDFVNGQFGITSVAGIIDEVGGFLNSFAGAGTAEVLLFSAEIQATAAGTLTFSSNAADDVPARETLFFGSDDALADEEINFGTATLTIADPTSGPVDLVAFARDLAAAGVEFWSTRQFSELSVQQRAIFEDGAALLPLMESLNDDGDINDEASDAGVTAVNTWIFPDQTSSSGTLLTLEEISQRSGVPIPRSEMPTLMEIPDISLTNQSPKHIPLDAYDPDGGPLTYEITTDNPDLLIPMLLEGNRSWLLDVEGFGPMVFEFFEQRASRATDRFIELTEDDFYNGITFHRIIDNFVIQGGDPTGTGSGSSSLPDFDDQFDFDLQHNRTGVLSMAKSTDDTNNSQFFVTEGPQRHLDFNHTVFGQLIEGESTRDAISNVSGGTTVTIRSATVFTDMENATLLLKAIGTGQGNVTVTVTDSQGHQDSQTFAVTATQDTRNSQAFLSDIPDFTVAAGTTHQFQLESNDIEDDNVFFFVDRTSPSDLVASVSDTGLVTVEIPGDAGGSEITLDVAVSQSSNPNSASRDEQRVRLIVESSSATADSFAVLEDSTGSQLDVLANDGLGSDAVITSLADTNLQGTVSISADGKSVVFAPQADFIGTTSFNYTVTSGGTSFIGTVEVDVENVVDGPTANNDLYPDNFTNQGDRDLLVEDSSGVILAVLNNDRPDPDQEEIVLITDVSDPQFGTVDWNSFNITYIPDPDFAGTDTFTYTIEGITSKLTSTATVTVEVPEINDVPTAGNDEFTVIGEQTRVFGRDELLLNDLSGPANENDQTLSIVEISYQGSGTATLEADGSIRYEPAAGFSGTETIEYTVRDDGSDRGVAAPRQATANITVTVEAPSIARADDFEVDFGSTANVLDVLANDQGTNLEILTVSAASNGLVEMSSDGTRLEYTPNAQFTGSDSFTYTARNAAGDEGSATVTITVDTQPPQARDDQFTVSGDMTLDVLANDLRGIGTTSLRVDSVTQPSNGVATALFGGAGIDYQPNSGFVGDDQFTYTIIDESGKMSTATVNVTVEVTANNPPLAFNDDAVVQKDGGAQAIHVLDNDTILPDTGETLTVVAVIVPPQNGTAVINNDGDDILYTPNAGFEGVDTLTYRVSDGNGGTATATAEIRVEARNVPPVAIADDLDVNTFGRQVFNLLSNDVRESGESLRIREVQTTGTRGSVEISEDGTLVFYTPNFSAFGRDTFTYVIEDETGLTSQGTVQVEVSDLLANSFFAGSIYTDANQDGQKQVAERGLGGVSVVLEGTDTNGTQVRQQTKTDLQGEFRFDRVAPGTYTVTEQQPTFMQNGLSVMGSSISSDDALQFSVGESLISADANAFGEGGLVPRFAAFNSLSGSRTPGLFAVLENEQLAWVESRGGWDDISSLELFMDGSDLLLRGTDSAGLELGARLPLADSSTVSVLGRSNDHVFLRILGGSQEVLSEDSVDDAFSAPVAVSDFYTVDQDTSLSIDEMLGVLSNDTDPEDDPLQVTLILEPTNGSLSLVDDGSFTYTPNAGFSGQDSFRYRATDGQFTSNVGVVTIQVTPVETGNELFGSVTTGSFDDASLLGVRTDLVSGAPAITRGHVDGDVDYTGHSNPPTYVDHHGFDPDDLDSNPGITPRPTGIYSTEQPDEDLIHNLEHGHVWISYNPSLISSDDLQDLEQLVRDGSPHANGGGVGVILTPRAANDTAISLASWARLLNLDNYDAETIRNFVEVNRGKAPEGFITP